METTSAAELFERYHLAAFRYFRRMTGRADTAEDLTQELFLAIVRGLPGYRPMGREAGWVFRIAQNVLARHFRPHRREEAGAEAAEDLAIASHQVLAIGLAEALRLLPVADREVILLREVIGLGYAEIAETVGTTEDSVRARLTIGDISAVSPVPRLGPGSAAGRAPGQPNGGLCDPVGVARAPPRAATLTARTDCADQTQLLKQRKVIVEPIFGVIKQDWGFRRWTVRGLENVRTQWAMLCVPFNLRRMHRAWAAGKLALA